MSGAAFTRLVHADWSVHPRGRWAASAVREDRGWRAEGPFAVPPLERYVEDLFAWAAEAPVLAGFDFPIGLPALFGARTAFRDFPAALDGFADPFYDVAGRADDIGVDRPFYPARPGHATRQHLLDGHGVASFADLTRRCERGGGGLKPAGCLFWTLGAAQVGRAALTGWRHVIGPAKRGGAALWPFDGDLDDLAGRGGLTLVETYPADGYARLGAPFRRSESKRRRADRAGKAAAIELWAAYRGVSLAPSWRAAIRDGFGDQDKGGDRFDAVIGLLAMIDILADQGGAAPLDDDVRRWEGWILGRPG